MSELNYITIKDSLGKLSEEEIDSLCVEVKNISVANRLLRSVNPHKEIIEAFKNGAKIQYYNGLQDSWVDTDTPEFVHHGQYRIKPELILVPFDITDVRLLFKEIIKFKTSETYSTIVRMYKGGVVLGGDYKYSYQRLLDDCEFENGEPCGKYIESIK